MTEEEYKSYAKVLSNLSSTDVIEKLSDIKENLLYRGIRDTTKELAKIISYLEEEKITALKLGMIEDANRYNVVIDTCDEFLAAEKVEMRGENLTSEELTPKQIVLAKTCGGNFYFTQDLKKINDSKEIMDGIKNIFEFIKSGKKPSSTAFAKKLTNNGSIKNIFEYKDFQTRIYTKYLIDNVVCVIGIRIKKGDNPKSIHNFLVERCTALNNLRVFENLNEIIKNGDKEKLINESEIELNSILNKDKPKKENKYLKEIPTVKEKAKEEDTTIPRDWLLAYEVAKIVYEKEGKIDVRHKYKVDDFAFGKWIKEQKGAKDKGLLSARQINLLDDLHINWHKKSSNKLTDKMIAPETVQRAKVVKKRIQARWMQKYLTAKKYYNLYGNVEMPTTYVDNETGIKLGMWIYNQKGRYENLTDEQKSLLDEIDIFGKKPLKVPDEIEILDLYPEKEPTTIKENPKGELISEIIPDLDNMDIDTLYKIKNLIGKTNKENDLNSELGQLYDGLLSMNKDELNQFMLELENVPLPSYKGKK